MPAWSNIYGLDMNSPEDKPGFDLTSARLARIVQSEIDKGIPPSKIIIGGFSQGGAAAIHYSLRSPHSFAGAIALSSWLPLRGDYPAALSPAASKMKIQFFHGDEDPVVPHKSGENSYLLLKNMLPTAGIKFTTIEVPLFHRLNFLKLDDRH